jgi:uncharacterized protein
MLVQEYGVWDKVLFGSDYPFTTVDASLEGIRKVKSMVENSSLPKINPDSIEQMLFRDTLRSLEIEG